MNVKQIFDHAAADYDRNRRQLIPNFDAFYGAALEQIPFERDAQFRVLDLGAGTGLLSALVLEAFPNATFTLVDLSAEMLDKARKRFEQSVGFQYQLVDLEREALSGQHDVAISALALHHVEPAHLQGVFEKVDAVLVSGGVLINADQTLGTTPENERRYGQEWVRSVQAQGSSDADVMMAFERMKADKTATLENQMMWLRAAGFADVDCWYKNYRFAVYSGRKS
ncbi:MAG: methyltransferase [Chloroflexota bacterium]